MSSPAIRFLMLSVCTVTLTAGLSVAASARTKTSSIERINKHKVAQRHQNVRNFRNHHFGSYGFGDQRSADYAWPARAPAPSGAVCPGNARSFDCKIWPPPFGDDPDRKMSGTDGG